MNRRNEDLVADAIRKKTLFDGVKVPKKLNPVRGSSVSQKALEAHVERTYEEEAALAKATILAEEGRHFEFDDDEEVKTFNKQEAKALANHIKKQHIWIAKRSERKSVSLGKDVTKGDTGHGGKGVQKRPPTRPSRNRSVNLTFPALGMYCWYLAEVDPDILSALYELLWQDDKYEVEYTSSDKKIQRVNGEKFIQIIYKAYVSEKTRQESRTKIPIASANYDEILAEIGYALLAPYIFAKKTGRPNLGFDALNRQFRRKGSTPLFHERCPPGHESPIVRFLNIAVANSELLPEIFRISRIKTLLEFAQTAFVEPIIDQHAIGQFYDTERDTFEVPETAVIARIAYIEAVLKGYTAPGVWQTESVTRLIEQIQTSLIHNNADISKLRNCLHEINTSFLSNVINPDIQSYFDDVCNELKVFIPELSEVHDSESHLEHPHKKSRLETSYKTPTQMLVRLRL